MVPNKKFKYIKRSFSHQPLRGFTWNSAGATVYPDFSFAQVMQMLDSDPIARGAHNHFVAKCIEGDTAVVRRSDRTYDRDEELRLEEKYMFRTLIIRKIFDIGSLANNVFVEIVRTTDNETKSLNILTPDVVEPVTAPNGDPISYKCKIPDPLTGKYTEWSKDDIVWIKFGDRSEGYAPVDLKALWENLSLKRYVIRYVGWLWKTGQYRLLYNFENSSNQDITDFITYAKRNDEYFNVPFITKGKMEIKLLRDMKEISQIVEFLKWLDSQTLVLMGVPPVDAGLPDGSGRSNADAQSNNTETRVVNMKKIVEDYINFDLFKKINKSTYLYQFGPQNRFAEKQAFEIAQIMSSMQMSNEVIIEFLQDRGLYFGTKEVFKQPEEDAITKAAKNPRDKDMMPSRVGKGTGEANQNQSQVTTREDQLKKV